MTLAWRLEWAVAARRRRLMVLNVAVPLALVAPLVLADAPAPHVAAALTVLFVLFGVFGSAIPLVRDGERGLLGRWVRAGLSERELLAGRAAAQSALDMAQLAPSVLLLLAARPAPAAAWLALPGALALSLLVANALGTWVAAIARSMAETALLSAVSTLLLLHGAGVFRTPAPGGVGAAAEAGSPFRLLHEAVLLATGGSGPAAGPGGAVLGIGVAATFLAATWLGAPRLIRSAGCAGT